MAVEFAVVQGTSRTTSGTKSYEVAGFGTPTAAIIIFNGARSASNPDTDIQMSIGFTDGTNKHMIAVYDDDGVSSSTSRRYRNANALAGHITTSLQSVALFSSWATNGITLNWSNPSTHEDYITVILIKGTTNAYAGVKRLTSTGVNDVTDPGFKPDLVFFTSTGASTGSGSIDSHAIYQFGAAHNNSSDTVSQAQIAINAVDGQGTSITSSICRDDSCTGQLHNAVQGWKASAQDFDANGFSLNTGSDSPGNDYVNYLALELDSADDADVSIIDTPTSTGTQAYTDPGFTPVGLILAQTYCSSVNSNTQNGTITIGAADGTNEYCQGIASEDNSATMDAQSSASTSAVAELYDDDGTGPDFDATLSSFDANGFTLNYTTTPIHTARKWVAITLKDTTATGITGTGALSAQASAISGTGVIERTGSGALSAQASTISGTGTVTGAGEVAGSGALTAQASAISGTGTVTGTKTGTGALAAQASTISGVGTVPSKGGGFGLTAAEQSRLERRQREAWERQARKVRMIREDDDIVAAIIVQYLED